MMLVKRYGAYTLIAAFFIYFLWSLSFPYYPEGTYPSPEQGGPNLRYDWTKVKRQYPLQRGSLIPFPTSAPKALPKIQADFKEEDATAKNIREGRREEVRKAFFRAWSNYRQKAWMHDELMPISGDKKDPFGGWAATLIDALDSLLIMGFDEEFSSCMKDVAQIDFGKVQPGLENLNVFETTIRHLGGLLSAYELSGEQILLQKAKELGEMLLHAFDTPNHMPKTRWSPHKSAQGVPMSADGRTLFAELASLGMEFVTLSKHTKDARWYDAATRITRVLEKHQQQTKLPGMFPIVVDLQKKMFNQDSSFTLGSMADSGYEYFAKMYALLGGASPNADTYKRLYEKSMDVAMERTLFRPMTPEDADILVPGIARVDGGQVQLEPQMQHLACYAGGLYALGGKLFNKETHLSVGRKITDGCIWAYKASPAGIMPEVSYLHACPISPDTTTPCAWDEKAYLEDIKSRSALGNDEDPSTNIATARLPKGFTAITDRRYVLRPEAIESVFVMYRVTGEQQWAAAAWDMWTAIEGATATEFGNAALGDISQEHPGKEDSMESFWLSETLKYFYLTFSEPSLISLDDYVFNTEAHPFKIPKPSNNKRA